LQGKQCQRRRFGENLADGQEVAADGWLTVLLPVDGMRSCLLLCVKGHKPGHKLNIVLKICERKSEDPAACGADCTWQVMITAVLKSGWDDGNVALSL